MATRKAAATGAVVRLIDATGSSAAGWKSAVADAVKGVAKDAPDPIGVEVVRQWADLKAGKIATYRVAVRVAYRQRLSSRTLS
ncbi:MAG: dodecin domain-containing protein [Chloroflexi bacterium]|nr:dodecin domain-containing protein [Chloroflexota bacterium]